MSIMHIPQIFRLEDWSISLLVQNFAWRKLKKSWILITPSEDKYLSYSPTGFHQVQILNVMEKSCKFSVVLCIFWIVLDTNNIWHICVMHNWKYIFRILFIKSTFFVLNNQSFQSVGVFAKIDRTKVSSFNTTINCRWSIKISAVGFFQVSFTVNLKRMPLEKKCKHCFGWK